MGKEILVLKYVDSIIFPNKSFEEIMKVSMMLTSKAYLCVHFIGQMFFITCCAHLIRQGKRNTVGFFSTALFQECIDAMGTPGTQGGLLIYTPALGRAMCPPGIGQSAGTLICMHLLRRGWRQIRASACAVVVCCLWRWCTVDRHHLLGVGCL